MDDVFDALSYVRRHTSNPQVLLICDTLSRLLQKSNTVADMSQVRVIQPIPGPAECPVCAARKATMAREPKPKRAKGKKRKRQVGRSGPRGNNAPAASPEGNPKATPTPNQQ